MLIIEKLQDLFNQLDGNNLYLLKDIYSDDMLFEDPSHKIYGLADFIDYCSNLYSNVTSCKFVFNSTTIKDKTAFLEWNMLLAHPRLNKGNKIIVSGISKIIFEEKIIHHRDYFDLGEMLYEHLPCIGSITKLIKKKLGQK